MVQIIILNNNMFGFFIKNFNVSLKFWQILYSNKIDINVISNYEVLNNNAKKVNGNKYTWTIDNSNNVDIMLTVSKTVKYEEPTKAKTFSTFQIIGCVVFAILTNVTYFLYRKKNSGKV